MNALKSAIAVCATIFGSSAHAQELIVGTLNAESASDTQPFRVASLIRDVGFVDVWAFQEVEDLEAAVEFTVAAGAVGGRRSFRYIVSESGEVGQLHRKNDLLSFTYNSSRLRHVETVELHGVRSKPSNDGQGGRLGDADWHLRGVLFVRFQDRDTGLEFYVGNMHLKCCGEGVPTRAHQTEIIKQWIERSDVPVILTGDSNIPIPPGANAPSPSSAAFDNLDSVAEWREPANPIKTQCSNFNSMLDHFFVEESQDLRVIDVRIEATHNTFCDEEREGGPDHRPVIARIDLGN